MTFPPPNLKVLFFDVFGTCVAQRQPVADELWNTARQAIESKHAGINSEIRANAERMTYDDWFEFGGQWDATVDEFIATGKANNAVDWQAVENQRLTALRTHLTIRGLLHPTNPSPESQLPENSLFSPSQLDHFSKIWHRLPPWSDTNPGLRLLNQNFTTVSLSNCHHPSLQALITHSKVPFTHVYSADLFDSFKPDPKVYLGAAEKLGVKPEECALVAAHLNDLKGAKACGFWAIYVERPLEEKMVDLKRDGIPDLTVREGEGGFVALAEKLGIVI